MQLVKDAGVGLESDDRNNKSDKIEHNSPLSYKLFLVAGKGLEPLRPKTTVFETAAAADYAIPPCADSNQRIELALNPYQPGQKIIITRYLTTSLSYPVLARRVNLFNARQGHQVVPVPHTNAGLICVDHYADVAGGDVL